MKGSPRVSVAGRWLLRPAQLPHPLLEAGPGCRRDHTTTTRLRSPAHLRDLRGPCRRLHLRPVALHGRQPDHDRPSLRTPGERRTRARNKALESFTGAEPADVHAVDAAWTSEAASVASAGNASTRKQGKVRSPLTDSNRRPPPYHQLVAIGGNGFRLFLPFPALSICW
jgi:hypothetical protein